MFCCCNACRISCANTNGFACTGLPESSITNDLAVLTPYEVTFQCFSPELASVLAGFGSAPHGFIVKAVNVAPSGAEAAAQPYTGYPTVDLVRPENERMIRPNYAGNNPYQTYPGTYQQPQPQPQPVMRGGLQTLLDEKQIKVTMVINVVRLLPTN